MSAAAEQSAASAADSSTDAGPVGLRLMAFVRFLSEHYFRTVVVMEDKELETSARPVILASNHSGMNFPWDCFVLFEFLLRRCGDRLRLRPLSAPVLLSNPVLSPFALPESWNHFSAPATMPMFEQLMRDGTSVFINPEGVAGIAKGFNRKYRLQRFSSAFVRMSLKYDRPVVPISVVNGEYLNPFAYSFNRLNTLAARLGIPFLPVGPTILLFAIFPCCAYISLPARLHYIIGKRIRLRDWTDKSYDELSNAEIRALTARLQETMQSELDRCVELYGRSPFDWAGFVRSGLELGPRSLALMPLTWPFLVHRAYLGVHPTPRRIATSALLCFALCLPVLGWPLLFAILHFTSTASGRIANARG